MDHVVVAVGLQADTRLASSSSGLEVDIEVGGYRVNSELQACSDVWVVSSMKQNYHCLNVFINRLVMSPVSLTPTLVVVVLSITIMPM